MRKVHMIGIGGIGMSGLALLLAETGREVTGSDIEENDIVKKLRRRGVIIDIGHDASHVKGRDLVVYSSSIRTDNPELTAARSEGTSVISRTELLKKVMDRNKRTVAVTGTHGKTTITAMASFLLEEAGFDPSVLIGGESPHFGGNAKLGKSETLVAEVDESDGRFVILRPTHIIVPNLEMEHVEHYRNEEHLVDTFGRFLAAQPPESVFFYNAGDSNLRKLAAARKGRTGSFGFSDEADISAGNMKKTAFGTQFDCFRKRKKIGNFTLNVPGAHNVLNALAVISLGEELGIERGVIKRAISNYKGVKRRFEVIGEANGARIVEDYAHHPTEIKATISAACSLEPGRLITVFQPHRYTRTKSFYREFSDAFAGSDEVILTEVYSASEQKIEGAGSRRIYEAMVKSNSVPVKFLKKSEIPEYLSGKIKAGDLVLVLGAGDIGKAARRLVERQKT